MPVLVTRPLHEAEHWSRLLQAQGVPAQPLPLIEIAPAPDAQAVCAAWQRLNEWDAVMFVSAHAIAQFFALRPIKRETTECFTAHTAHPRAYVTGPGSVAALLKVGVDAACIDAPPADARQFDSEALWAVVQHQVQPGFRLLIVRGATSTADAADGSGADVQGQGRDWLAQHMRSAGAQVDTLAAYRRAPPTWTADQVDRACQAATDGSIWLFSSSEALANLVRLCPHQTWAQARAVATHPRIAQAVRSAGFGVVCESRPVVDAIVASIESLG